jgi:signal transduction histidine kinase
MICQSGTRCAPPERLTVQQVREEHAKLSENVCSSYFDFFPLPLVVLDSHRQVVFSNRAFTKVLGADDLSEYLAMRLGEAMGCIYADTGENGCGTSEHCRECGALHAVMKSIEGNAQAEQESQLLLKNGKGIGARDLRVFVSPWVIENETYYVVSINDVGDEKRRRVLEKIFFHDILNSAGGARGLADLLVEEVQEEAKETVSLIQASLFGLVEEIQKQKQLLAVENDEYISSPITLQGLEVIQSIAAAYCAHPLAIGKSIHVDPESANATIKADYPLLRRVIVNMLVNALEATSAGGSVSVGLRSEGPEAVFWVRNSAVMPERVKLQVFKRSFSTKGQDRGIGTYSIRLLTENYLKGEVGFTSQESQGTTFWVKLKKSSSI